MKINADDCIESSAHCSYDNDANKSPSQGVKMDSCEPVKVIFTLPSETGCEGTKYRPLRIMPVSVNSLIGKHYSWDFIQKQFRSQNQLQESKPLKLFGKFASNGTIFPLNNEETYETALRVAELREDSFDIMIQPSFCEYSSESENEVSETNPTPIPKAVDLGSIAEQKISNCGNDDKVEELKPLWFNSMKDEIKKEVTSDILSTLISALQDMKCQSEVKTSTTTSPENNDTNFHESSEAKAVQSVVHSNIICDYCEKEIRGIRYKCSQCPDFDLCEVCERITDAHFENHIFQKIKKPVQKKVYGGEDIILSLDVDLPTGRTEVKDIRFVPNQKKSNVKTSTKSFHDTSSDVDSHFSNMPKAVDLSVAKDPSVRPKHIERKVAELNKKVEKLRVKGQSLQKQLLQSNDNYQDVKSNRYPNSKLLFLGGTLLSEETAAEGSKIQPGTRFKKVWKVKNSGTKSWNSRTTVRFCWGNTELEPMNKLKEFSVPPLKPGQEGRITIRFTISKTCSYGFYHSHWRLHHRGQPFGQRLVCKVFVDPNDEKCHKGCCCAKCGYEGKVKQKIVEFKEKGANLEAALTAVREIKFCDNCEEIPIKMNVKSHTTTPTNTPFDVSPPKSPEPSPSVEVPDEPLHSMSKNRNESSEFSGSVVHGEILRKENVTDGFLENDSLSAFSYSSSESSDEFVFVPLPRCFDLTTPFSCVNETESALNLNVDLGQTLSDAVDTDEKIPLVAESSQTDPLNYGAITVNNETGSDDILQGSESQFPAEEQLLQLSECFTSPIKNTNTSEIGNCEIEQASAPKLVQAEDNVHIGSGNSESRIFSENASSNQRNSSTNPFLGSMSHAQHQSSENMIHVLPESIVNGALNVAANVVQNVSRALFSAQSLGSNENYNWVTSPPPAVIPTAHQFFDGRTDAASAQSSNTSNSTPMENSATKSSQSRLTKAMSQLFEMGFWNQQLNEELLAKHNFDVNNAVEDLLSPDRQDFEVVSTQPRQAASHSYTEFD